MISKKLQRGLKLSEVRVKDGRKNMHISKNWKKDEGLDTEMYYWSVCWKRKKGSGVVLCERLLGIECRLIVGLNLLP